MPALGKDDEGLVMKAAQMSNSDVEYKVCLVLN